MRCSWGRVINLIYGKRDITELLVSGVLFVDGIEKDNIRENGIDLRIGYDFCKMRNTPIPFDPRNPGRPEDFYECGRASEFILINPNEHVLLHTIEYIEMPEHLMGFLNIKSTYSRLGLSIPPTIVDAGFKGQLTIHVYGSSFPVKLYVGDAVFYMVLAELRTPVEKYGGNYGGQVGVVLPRLFRRGGLEGGEHDVKNS